jgi:hypothetical protein
VRGRDAAGGRGPLRPTGLRGKSTGHSGLVFDTESERGSADASGCCSSSRASVNAGLVRTLARSGGCCTKPSAKTWAAPAVTVAERARSAEAGQGAPRASDDLWLFRPRP